MIFIFTNMTVSHLGKEVADHVLLDLAVLYASIARSADDGGFEHLAKAVDQFLQSLAGSEDVSSRPERIWQMQYQQQRRSHTRPIDPPNDHISVMKSLSLDLALQDDVLEDVKRVWRQVLSMEGEIIDEDVFLKFEERDGNGAVDDDEEEEEEE
jgi:hypothetical protein